VKLVAELSRGKGRIGEQSLGDPSLLVAARVVATDKKSVGVSGTRDVGATSAAWVVLLARYEWCWFGTFTFKDAIHPEAADKAFKYWVSLVGQSYLGKNWRRKAARAPQWVRGLEWQRRDVLHYHALITNVPREYAEFAWRVFFRQLWVSRDIGGFMRLDACDGSDAVYSYLTKYVVKGGEIDISPNLPAFVPRLALS